MSETPINPEIVARAVIRESGPAPDPEAQRVVNEIRSILATGGPERALEVASGRSVDMAKITHVIDENVGSERDERGKRVVSTPEEGARKIRADREKSLILTYSESGYDALSDSEKIRCTERVLSIAYSIPAYQPILDAMTDDQRRDFAERILKDPEARVSIAGVLSERVTDEALITEDAGAEIVALRNEMRVLDDLTARHIAKRNELDEALTRLSEPLPDEMFKAIAESSVALSDKEREAEDILERIEATRTNYEKWKDLHERAQRGEDPLPGSSPEFIKNAFLMCERPMKIKEEKLAPLEREIEEIKTRLDELKAGIGSERPDEDTINALKDEENALISEVREQQNKVEEAVRARGEKLNARGAQEEAFVSSVEGVIAEGTSRYFDELNTRATNSVRESLAKASAEATEERDKAIADGLMTRFFDGKRIHRGQIKRDWERICGARRGEGPDTIIEQLLRKGGLSDAEVSKALADVDFMKAKRAEVAEAVAKMHFLKGGFMGRGGKVSPDEVVRFAMSDWGKDVIKNGLAGSNALRDVIKEVDKTGILTKRSGSLGELLGSINYRSLLKILLIALGIGSVAYLGPSLAMQMGSMAHNARV